jgi:integrase
MATKTKACKANVGSRTEPKPCGKPIANGMLMACAGHKTTLIPTTEKGVYYRGGQYVVVWRHRGKQHKSFHRTLAEAREAKGGRQAGDRQPTTRSLLEDHAREWIDGYAGRTSQGFTENTRAAYRRSLDTYVIPFFAGWKLADVERSDIRRLVKSLEDHGLAPASVIKNLTPAKAMFATAVDDDLLKSNPCSGVRVNRRRAGAEEEPEAKAMSRAELASLMAEIPENWVLLFELLAKTGLRISEALGLEWSDIDFGKLTLRVRRQYYRGDLRQLKTHSGRRDLPLSPALAQRLWTAQQPDGPVFHTRDGNRLQDRNVRRVLDAAGDRAGLEWVHFHTFRHTCASMLFESGKNIRQVATWLGHTDPGFTLQTYVHLMDGGLGSAGFLDAAVGNTWATGHPEIAANAEPPAAAESAS